MRFLHYVIGIHLGYKKPKTIVFTPNRKHLGKAVAQKRKMAVARECCKDSGTLKYIIAIHGLKMQKEIRTMCSDNTKSFLQSQSKEKLTIGLSGINSIRNCPKTDPLYSDFCKLAQKPGWPDQTQKLLCRLCAAMILKHRQPRMNLLQKIISLILYAGHASPNVTITVFPRFLPALE